MLAVATERWSDGIQTELRCWGCGAALFRELGTRLMTADEHAAWRNERALPRARVRR